jgi:hypothetical protein
MINKKARNRPVSSHIETAASSEQNKGVFK